MNRSIARLMTLALACALAGCATVQPWEKANLANPEMRFDGDPLQSRFEQHTYFSKESASGGYGVGGGGCGCN